jgi:hypothetical protein
MVGDARTSGCAGGGATRCAEDGSPPSEFRLRNVDYTQLYTVLSTSTKHRFTEYACCLTFIALIGVGPQKPLDPFAFATT